MSVLLDFFSESVWQQLGLTLLHFLWQGLAVAAVVMAVVRVFGFERGASRYVIYLGAFVFLGLCPLVTFFAVEPLGGVAVETVVDVSQDEPIVTSPDSTLPVAASSDGLAAVEGDANRASAPAVSADVPVTPSLEVSSELHASVTQEIADASEIAEIAAASEVPETFEASGAIAPSGPSVTANLKPFLPYVSALWLFGVALLSARLVLGFFTVQRLRRDASALPTHLSSRVAHLAKQLGMPDFNRVLVSDSIRQPLAFGCIKPVVLIPLGMLTQLDPQILEAMIAHEMAHVKRHDIWINLFQRIVECLLFFHPVVWWLSRLIREEREVICDADASEAIGEPLVYANALQAAAMSESGGVDSIGDPQLASPLKPTPLSLPDRIRHVLGMAQAPASMGPWPAGVMALVIVLLIGGGFQLEAFDEAAVAQSVEPAEAVEEGAPYQFTGGFLNPDGSPAAEMVFAVVVPGQHLYVKNGRFDNTNEQNEGIAFYTTDAEGEFTIPKPSDEGDVIYALNEKGVYGRAAEYFTLPTVSLRAWGRIEGRVMEGKEPVGQKLIERNQDVAFTVKKQSAEGDERVLANVAYAYTTDDQGYFEFERVDAFWIGVKLQDEQTGVERSFYVQVSEGNTVEVAMGGQGRPVIGRVLGQNAVDGFPIKVSFTTFDYEADQKRPYPADYKHMSVEEKRAWSMEWHRSDEGQAYLHRNDDVVNTSFSVPVQADGSFRVEDVPPGKYYLRFMYPRVRVRVGDGVPVDESPEYAVAIHPESKFEFTVAEVPGGLTDEPLDVGQFEQDERFQHTMRGAPPVHLVEFAKDVELISMRRSPNSGGAYIAYKGKKFVDNGGALEAGIHMVVVQDGQVVGPAKRFSTQEKMSEVQRFVDAIHVLDDDAYVILAVSCSAEAVRDKAPHVNVQMQKALMSIGVRKGLLGEARAQSYYVIGRKGMLRGQAYEELGKQTLFFPEDAEEKLKGRAVTLEYHGRVLNPDGTPAEMATVLFVEPGQTALIQNGRFDLNAMDNGNIHMQWTNPDGVFRIPDPELEGQVLVLSDVGYQTLRMPSNRFNRDLTLNPWGRIEGRLMDGDEPMAEKTLGIDWRMPYPSDKDRSKMAWLFFDYATGSDEEGWFAFERVWAFDPHVKVKDSSLIDTRSQRVHLVGGETSHMEIGGAGGSVIGRLKDFPAEITGGEYRVQLLFNPDRLPDADPDSGVVPPEAVPYPEGYDDLPLEERRGWLLEWWESPKGKAYYAWKARKRSPQHLEIFATVGADGSFRFDDVEAGKYELRARALDYRQLALHGAASWTNLNHRFEMPVVDDGREGAAVDLGMFTLPERTTGPRIPFNTASESKAVSGTPDSSQAVGRILSPDGTPAVGATLVIIESGQSAVIVDGRFDEEDPRNENIKFYKTDAEGGYRFSRPKTLSLVLVYGEQGRGSVSLGRTPYDLTLKPWGRIEGQLIEDGQPAAEKQIEASTFSRYILNLNADPNQPVDSSQYVYAMVGDIHSATTGEEGRFVIERVNRGRFALKYLGDEVDAMRSESIEVGEGLTTQVQLGGVGRSVVGGIQLPGNRVTPNAFTRVILESDTETHLTTDPNTGVRRPFKIPYPAGYDELSMADKQRWYEVWQQSPEGKAYYTWAPDQMSAHDRKRIRFSQRVDGNGNFEFKDVPPGYYKITANYEIELPRDDKTTAAFFMSRKAARIHSPRKTLARFSQHVDILGGVGSGDDESLELGTLNLELYTPPTVGQTSNAPLEPLIKPADLVGFAKDVRLISMGRRPYTGGALVRYKDVTLVDKSVNIDYKPGVYMVVVKDGEPVGEAKRFRTQLQKAEVQKFVDAVDAIDEDSYVIIVVSCTAEAVKAKGPHVNEAMQEALKSVGAGEGLLGRERALSYYLIGRKGLKSGLAYEAVSSEQLQFPPKTFEELTGDAAMLPFKVVDEVTGEPLGGVALTVQGDRHFFAAVTDEAGVYEVPLIGDSKRRVTITVDHPGYSRVYVAWRMYDRPGVLPDAFTLRLKAAVTIGGVIEDGGGEPIAGVSVSLNLQSQPSAIEGWRFMRPVDVVTDEEGRWSYDRFPVGAEKISFGLSHVDYSVVGIGNFDLPPMGKLLDQTSVMVMQAGQVFKGRVSDGEGAAVVGADVRLKGVSVKTDSEGLYVFKKVKAGLLTVSVQAEGFGPEMKRIHLSALSDTADFTLEAGHVLAGRVVDLSGEPVVGARVSANTWRDARSLEWKVQTDDEGRFSWSSAPADEMLIDVLKPGYASLYRQAVEASDEELVLVLAKPIKVSVTVVDDVTGELVTEFKVNTTTHYEGSGELKPRWDDRLDRAGRDGVYETTSSYNNRTMRITARGYAAAYSKVYSMSDGDQVFEFRLKEFEGLTSRVFNPDGSVAGNVELVLATGKTTIEVENGVFLSRQRNRHLHADDQGAFQMAAPGVDYLLAAGNEKGYVQVRLGKDERPGDLTLKPWGRIEGRLMKGDEPVAGEQMAGHADRQTGVYPISSNVSMQKTDEEGRFVFDYVLPGMVNVSIWGTVGRSGSMSMVSSKRNKWVRVEAEETVEMQLGGEGRAVIGKVLPLEGAERVPGGMRMMLMSDVEYAPPYPDEVVAMRIDQRQAWDKVWRETAEGKDYFESYRSQVRVLYIDVNSDTGEFRIEDVLPGRYKLRSHSGWGMLGASVPAGPRGSLDVVFEVPAVEGERSDEVVDLGDLPLTPYDPGEVKPDAKVGDTVVDFEVESFGGETLRLGDYRGKYLLIEFLSVGFAGCRDQQPYLKEVYEKFGSDERFAMLGLSVSKDPTDARRYAKEEGLDWPHGDIGSSAEGTKRADFGNRSHPAIWLVSPEGEILDIRLREEGIVKRVGEVLGK